MEYVSTRDNGSRVGFLDTVMTGLAPDGGLFVPKEIPVVGARTLERLKSCTNYYQVAYIVLNMLAPDIPRKVLWDMLQDTYNASIFGNVVDGDSPCDIVPVRNIGDNNYLLRLSNGPTGAFKDMALQLLGRLFEYLLERDGGVLNILGATSGDTGTAAIYAMLGRAGINVFMLSPRDNMSTFQSRHMWSVNDPHIHNLTVPTFDDGQRIVKGVSADLKFKEEYSIGSVNSINWARVAAQVVYYFWGGLKINGLNGEPFDVAVPTGNFGDICAGYVAKRMGLPIRQLILATNENDVLDEFFRTGVYRPRKKMVSTISPSMDINMASNFERYIYYLLEGDAFAVRELWRQLDDKGMFDVSDKIEQIKESGFESMCVRESYCKRMIDYFYKEYRIVIDPHTATAMHVALILRKDDTPCLILETAQPCKFDETIVNIIREPAPRPKAFEGMEDKEVFFKEINPSVEEVKDYIREHV